MENSPESQESVESAPSSFLWGCVVGPGEKTYRTVFVAPGAFLRATGRGGADGPKVR